MNKYFKDIIDFVNKDQSEFERNDGYTYVLATFLDPFYKLYWLNSINLNDIQKNNFANKIKNRVLLIL